MNIEWVGPGVEGFLDGEPADEAICLLCPVVRLAEVDAVIAEAVWAMENIPRLSVGHRDWERITAFLTSPLVAAWRKRQKKEGGAK